MKLAARLVANRLRWYSVSTMRLVLRHWQWFVLALVMLPMGLSLNQLLMIIGSPFLALLHPSVSLTARFSYLLLLSVLAVLWVIPQRKYILGQAFAPYMRSLPIPALHRALADLAVLFVATSILLIPAFAAVLVDARFTVVAVEQKIASLAVIVSVLLLIEYSALHRQWLLLLLVALPVNTLIIFALSSSSYVAWFVSMGIAELAMVFGVMTVRQLQHKQSIAPQLHVLPREHHALRSTQWIFHKLLWKCVLNDAVSSGLKLVVVAALSASAVALQFAFEFDVRALNVNVAIIAINSIVISGFYRLFKAMHKQSNAYTAALPIRTGHWVLLETIWLVVVALLVCLVVCLALITFDVANLSQAIVLLSAQAVLMAMLRWPANRGGANAVLASILIAIAWAMAVMIIL